MLVTGKALGISALIGILMLMGIAAKNSILLVDYVIIGRRDFGLDRRAALLDAAHKRARPIVMTTVAMTAGMLPIALALGACGSAPAARAPAPDTPIAAPVEGPRFPLPDRPVATIVTDAWSDEASRDNAGEIEQQSAVLDAGRIGPGRKCCEQHAKEQEHRDKDQTVLDADQQLPGSAHQFHCSCSQKNRGVRDDPA
jgi:hypothetical protein